MNLFLQGFLKECGLGEIAAEHPVATSVAVGTPLAVGAIALKRKLTPKPPPPPPPKIGLKGKAAILAGAAGLGAGAGYYFGRKKSQE